MTDQSPKSIAGPPLSGAPGSAGRCVICGSGRVTHTTRENGTRWVHCNDCGTEVTLLMHLKKQPNAAGEPQPRKPRT